MNDPPLTGDEQWYAETGRCGGCGDGPDSGGGCRCDGRCGCGWLHSPDFYCGGGLGDWSAVGPSSKSADDSPHSAEGEEFR